MTDHGILPRITVPDEQDRATVANALIGYWRVQADRAHKSPSLVVAVEEGEIIMGLLRGLITETQREYDALVEQGIHSILEGENPEAA